MIKMPEQKKKVVLKWNDSWSIEHLLLTESQIRLLNWLIENDFINDNRLTVDIIEDQQEWDEV